MRLFITSSKPRTRAMIKLNTRLMYPEPTDTGSEGTPAPVEEKPAENAANNAEPENKSSNPFDFANFASDTEEPKTDEPAPEPVPDEEYKLSFTPEDGMDEEDVTYFTNKAKELNLPADGATQFIRDFGKMLNERDTALRAEEEKALRQEWGKKFDGNLQQVGAYMGRMFKQLGLSREQMLEFATPAHYRLFHHVMKQNSEKAAVTAPAHLTPEQKSARLQELARERVRLRYSNDNEGAERVTAEINRISMEKYGHGAYL